MDGAEDEDTAPRWLNHFYRPTDERGYYLPVTIPLVGRKGWQQSALKWGGVKNPSNDYDYFDALNVYQTDRTQAYYILGHVLHLVEDTSLPEHTHLECHANVCFGTVCFAPCGPLGYETYVTEEIFTGENDPLPSDIRENLETGVDLGRIPYPYQGNADLHNGLVRYENIGDYIVNLAKISYYLNRHKADLRKRNRNKQGASLGPLGEIFPELGYNPDCGGPVGRRWYIPGIGCLDTGFDEGGWWETWKEPKTKKHRKTEPRGFYTLLNCQKNNIEKNKQTCKVK